MSKKLKIAGIIIGTFLISSTLGGCFFGGEEVQKDTRVLPIDEEVIEFPRVLVDDKSNFVFDYRITNASLSDQIADETFEKTFKPKGKYLVVEISAFNRSQVEEFGNLPLVTIDYNGQSFNADADASEVKAEIDGASSYITKKIESGKKGKYIKVFDLENYDPNVKNFTVNFDYMSGKAKGSVQAEIKE